MKKKSIGLIIGLMGFALLGVMSMQLYFLRQSYQMQSDLFDRSVNDALNNVVSKLAKQDAINFLNKKARRMEGLDKKPDYNTAKTTFVSNPDDGSDNYARSQSPAKRRMTARERRLNLLRDSLEQVIMNNKLDEEFFNMARSGELRLNIRYEEYTDEFGNVHQRMTDPTIVQVPGSHAVAHKPARLYKYDTAYFDYI
ncbi:MAG TPA: hypothetical protein VHC47_02245, partial [Mucilaginibacter sp.]|nr:hypothetical protein [Mucilaginibacter sp.]